MKSGILRFSTRGGNKAQRAARAKRDGRPPEGRWYGDQPHVQTWRCPDCSSVVEREQVSQHAWDAHGKAIDSSRPREAGFRPHRT